MNKYNKKSLINSLREESRTLYDSDKIKSEIKNVPIWSVRNEEFTENVTISKRKVPKKAWASIVTACACLVLLLGVGIMYVPWGNIGDSTTVLTVDINPSISIQLNKKNIVEDVEAVNLDGAKLLNNIDLKGVEANDALNLIMREAVLLGYIEVENDDKLPNAVKLNAINAKDEVSNELAKIMKVSVDEFFKSVCIGCVVIAGTASKKAEEDANLYGITSGKMQLLDNLMGLSGVTYKDRKEFIKKNKNKSIKELNSLIQKQEEIKFKSDIEQKLDNLINSSNFSTAIEDATSSEELDKYEHIRFLVEKVKRYEDKIKDINKILPSWLEHQKYEDILSSFNKLKEILSIEIVLNRLDIFKLEVENSLIIPEEIKKLLLEDLTNIHDIVKDIDSFTNAFFDAVVEAVSIAKNEIQKYVQDAYSEMKGKYENIWLSHKQNVDSGNVDKAKFDEYYDKLFADTIHNYDDWDSIAKAWQIVKSKKMAA